MNDADVHFEGQSNIYDHVGSSFASGDFDGDSQIDILIGAHSHGGTGPTGGRIYIIYGDSLSGESYVYLPTDADLRLEGEYVADSLGFSMASIDDIDGDGRPEILGEH